VGGGGGVMVTAREAEVFSIVGNAFLVLVGNDGGVDGPGGWAGWGDGIWSFSLFVSVVVC